MRGKVYILVYCPIDTLQWGSTHSALGHASKVTLKNALNSTFLVTLWALREFGET